MKEKPVTAVDVENMIKHRYCPPSYAFLPQVRNGTGFYDGVRTADALVMGLWPSRGLHLIGFEIKVNRGDWKKELQSPGKAEAIAQYCDFWYVVAPKGIVNLDEVPENWGLMVPNGQSTKIVREAKKLKATEMDRSFLAAILRRTTECLTPEAKIKDAYAEGFVKGKEEANWQNKYAREERDELQKSIFEFQKKSGIQISRWDRGNVAEAVKVVLDGGHLNIKERLVGLLKTSQEITESISEKINALEKVADKTTTTFWPCSRRGSDEMPGLQEGYGVDAE